MAKKLTEPMSLDEAIKITERALLRDRTQFRIQISGMTAIFLGLFAFLYYNSSADNSPSWMPALIGITCVIFIRTLYPMLKSYARIMNVIKQIRKDPYAKESNGSPVLGYYDVVLKYGTEDERTRAQQSPSLKKYHKTASAEKTDKKSTGSKLFGRK